MPLRPPDPVHLLLAVGLVAFLLAGLSIVDMFVPRPYDGVLLESDALGQLRVRQVVPGSGADRAGLRPGDRIVGIDRELLRSVAHAARQVNRHEIGEAVPYYVRSAAGSREVEVELGRRRMGDPYYLYACLLGFSFFLVGLFVLLRQPRMRAAQVFYLLGTLFMLFLICRLRPASYSQVDRLVLSTGTAALLFLPATFLHFFLIFPRPVWTLLGGRPGGSRLSPGAVRALLTAIYLLPPLVLLGTHLARAGEGGEVRLISGAPLANWWVLAVYILLGLSALALSALRVPSRRERRGAALVFFGAVFGLLPFLVLAVGFPALLHTEKLLVYGVVPLVLVPLTFAYAIVRFQLLDIRVLLKKSLLYTVTTAVITALYAAAIAAVGWLSRDTAVAESPWAPLILALVIVLLFEPLRRRLQAPVERFFFAERARLQRTAREMAEAFAARPDLEAVVRDLVEKLPRLLGLHFAALYRLRDGALERVAGPASLPARLRRDGELEEALRRRGGLARLHQLASLGLRSRSTGEQLGVLEAAGVEVLGALASSRREIGLVMLSGKSGQMVIEDDELELLQGLLHQASMALETHLLLEERARQAELERELEIAASIQASLLPSGVRFAPGWEVAAVCRPARHVGGDFIAQLPASGNGRQALALGDVAGKSVSGALVMMAAYEILSSLAMTAHDPEELVRLANQRLRHLGRRNFVALAYFVPLPDGSGLGYLLAGQPQPMKRHASGRVSELPLPSHRLPLGALAAGGHRLMRVEMAPGEVVLGYSDGVVEARSGSGDLFGLERLRAVVAAAPASPRDLVDRVLEAVTEFTGGSEPYDDLTLLAVSRREVAR